MRAHVFDVPAGHDISACLARFSRLKNLDLCVLAGTGDVANVTLRQLGDADGTFSFIGRFDILSISATILPPPPAASAAAGFTITLAGPQGRVVAGRVAGTLVAAGKVVLMAAVFTEPTFHLLPAGNAPITVSAESDRAAELHQMVAPESCAMAVYSCHVPSEVIWAPTASRLPPSTAILILILILIPHFLFSVLWLIMSFLSLREIMLFCMDAEWSSCISFELLNIWLGFQDGMENSIFMPCLQTIQF